MSVQNTQTGDAAGQGGGQEPTQSPAPTTGQEPTGQQSTSPKTKESDPDGDDLGFSEKQLAYVKKLRSEAAGSRTRAKELETQVGNLSGRMDQLQSGLKKLFGEEGSDLPPERQIEQLTAHNEELELQSAISEAALQSGITGDSFEYFDFLLRKEIHELEEGQELSEERMAEIVAKASSRGVGPAGNTSVSGGKEGGNPPPPANQGGGAEVTLESFVAMTITERSELFQKNRPLYDSLHQEARRTGKLV